MLVHEVHGAGGERHEIRHVAPVQHEQHEFVGRAHPGARTRRGDLAELEAGLVLQHRLEVVRVVVLAVDEDDLLRPAGDVELAVVLEREIAGAQPAVRP